MENQLSKNFTLAEMTCSTVAMAAKINNNVGTFEYNNLQRLCKEVLQPIRDKWGEAIIVTSGYRCPELNRRLKGSASSAHLKGLAVDIDTPNNEKLFHLIISMMNNGEISVDQLIDEKNFSWLHIGLKENPNNNRNQVLHL